MSTIVIKAISITLQNNETYRFECVSDAKDFIFFGTFKEAKVLYIVDGQPVMAVFDDYYAIIDELS